MRTLYTLLAACFALTASAQRAKFSATEIDMGQISWHTEAVARIEVKNTGNRPLLITDVTTDCGCTVVNFDKAPIAPGHTSVISATYDAETLGTFAKYITVSTNASDAPTDILLTGCVQTRVIDYSQQFPFKVDNVLLSTDHIEFDDVNKGDLPQQTLLVLNNGKQNYVPELTHLPPYLTAICQPEVLRPGRIGPITLTLDSRLLPNLGVNRASIYIARFPGDKVRQASEIELSATLLPQFNLTEQQLQQSPTAVIPTHIDLGKRTGKKNLKGSLTLENQGSGVLHVSALQVYNPGISVSLSKSTLQPGEKATLKIKLAAVSSTFKGRRRILLITDDPKNSKIAIDVVAQ